MDTEDREHFRTIAEASPKRLTGSVTSSGKAQSNSPPGLDYCRIKAKAITGCYRRDEAQDPDAFAAALAVVLADYPGDLIDYAADPRTGVITKFPMGLPNVGQIKQFLEDLLAKKERLQRYEALPKFQPFRPAPLPPTQNLFVPDDNRRYQEMLGKAQKQPDRAQFESQVCTDGIERNGIRVPLGWWEGSNAA